jgi:hypothetical protein
MSSFTALLQPKPDKEGVNLLTVVRELQRPLLAYKEVQTTINGITRVNHGLNRQPTGWIVVDKTSYGDIIRVSWDALTVTLTSTVPVECKVLFF